MTRRQDREPEYNLIKRARALAKATNHEIGDVEADFLVTKYKADGVDDRSLANGMQRTILSKLVRDGVLVERTSSAYGSDINMNPLKRFVLADEPTRDPKVPEHVMRVPLPHIETPVAALVEDEIARGAAPAIATGGVMHRLLEQEADDRVASLAEAARDAMIAAHASPAAVVAFTLHTEMGRLADANKALTAILCKLIDESRAKGNVQPETIKEAFAVMRGKPAKRTGILADDEPVFHAIGEGLAAVDWIFHAWWENRPATLDPKRKGKWSGPMTGGSK